MLRKYSTVIRTCPNCGKEFKSIKGIKYCSTECQREARKKRRLNPECMVGAELVCPECGIHFFKAHASQIYCSVKCRNHAEAKRYKSALEPKPVEAPQPKGIGLDERLKSLNGRSYADWQKEQTFKMIPKIDTNL